jgi:uncharacterized protein (TIGR02453 family)
MNKSSFPGFPKECLTFFEQLGRHNDRDWFEEHRGDYEKHVLEPAAGFIAAMGEKLKAIAPRIIADPRINKSIFRLYRDTRFSKDKTPYKTHLGIYMWEGEDKKLECPGFYFHLEPGHVLIGGGIYILTKPLLEIYRQSVVHERHGPELEKILDLAQKDFPNNLENEKYKKVPRGFTPDHPRAELLKFKGMTIGEQTPVSKVFFSEKCVDYVYRRFEKMAALHNWLLAMTKRMPRDAN